MRSEFGQRALSNFAPLGQLVYSSHMTRVMVIGKAGGGKSTMCSAICAAHGLPYFAIDKIQWKPNWVSTPETEYQDAHEEILSGDRWLQQQKISTPPRSCNCHHSFTSGTEDHQAALAAK